MQMTVVKEDVLLMVPCNRNRSLPLRAILGSTRGTVGKALYHGIFRKGHAAEDKPAWD